PRPRPPAAPGHPPRAGGRRRSGGTGAGPRPAADPVSGGNTRPPGLPDRAAPVPYPIVREHRRPSGTEHVRAHRRAGGGARPPLRQAGAVIPAASAAVGHAPGSTREAAVPPRDRGPRCPAARLPCRFRPLREGPPRFLADPGVAAPAAYPAGSRRRAAAGSGRDPRRGVPAERPSPAPPRADAPEEREGRTRAHGEDRHAGGRAGPGPAGAAGGAVGALDRVPRAWAGRTSRGTF